MKEDTNVLIIIRIFQLLYEINQIEKTNSKDLKQREKDLKKIRRAITELINITKELHQEKKND